LNRWKNKATFLIGAKQPEDKSVIPVANEELRRSSESRKLPRIPCEWEETEARKTLVFA